MIRRLCLALALLAASVLAPVTATAQQDFSQLNDWRVLCDPNGSCQIRNEVIQRGGQGSHILIYRIGQAEVVEFKTPLGIDIRRGVVLRVDRRTRFPTELLTCKADGCIGFTAMTTPLLRALASGSDVEVVFVNSDTSNEEAYSFSLVGFSRSYNTFFAQ